MNVHIYIENSNLEALQESLKFQNVKHIYIPPYSTQPPWRGSGNNKTPYTANTIEVSVTPDEFRWLEDNK